MHCDKVRHEDPEDHTTQTSVFCFSFFQNPSDSVILVVGARMIAFHREQMPTHRLIRPIDAVCLHLKAMSDNRPKVFLGTLKILGKFGDQRPDEATNGFGDRTLEMASDR